MAHDDDTTERAPVSRRAFLKGGAAATGALSASILPSVPAEAQLPDAADRDPRRSTVELRVNGVRYRQEVANCTTLLQFLRDDLKLTGTKMGCDRAQCGACTVILNGRNVYSCTTLAVEASAGDVLTIEGLADGRCAASDSAGVRRAQRLPVRLLHLGPDHDDQGAARSNAESDRRRRAARAQRKPVPVLGLQEDSRVGDGGVAHDARVGSGTWRSRTTTGGGGPMNVIGKRGPNIDAVERVTGRAKYTGDIDLPGMLVARVLRSPHAHARIARDRRKQGGGVCRRARGHHLQGCAESHDLGHRQYALNERVRFKGEAVAAVAAVDAETAERGGRS